MIGLSDKSKDSIIEWAFNQGIATLLLIGLFTANVYGVHYALNRLDVMVPKHLEQIQKGYEKQEILHERELRYIIDSYEKTLNRFYDVNKR